MPVAKCPICKDPSACKSYPHLWELLTRGSKMAAEVHRRQNDPTPEEEAARAAALIAEHPPSAPVPISPCGGC